MAMTGKEKAELRSTYYSQIATDLKNKNPNIVNTEPITTGLLLTLDNGSYVEIRVIAKDENKFNVEAVRRAYQKKLEKAESAMVFKAE